MFRENELFYAVLGKAIGLVIGLTVSFIIIMVGC